MISLFETRIGHISNWKGFAGPNGSRNGLFAALLAKETSKVHLYGSDR